MVNVGNFFLWLMKSVVYMYVHVYVVLIQASLLRKFPEVDELIVINNDLSVASCWVSRFISKSRQAYMYIVINNSLSVAPLGPIKYCSIKDAR